jgi:hypothetical protein
MALTNTVKVLKSRKRRRTRVELERVTNSACGIMREALQKTATWKTAILAGAYSKKSSWLELA